MYNYGYAHSRNHSSCTHTYYTIYTNILTVHNYINNYSSYMYISINNTFRPKCLKEILELLFKQNSTEKN